MTKRYVNRNRLPHYDLRVSIIEGKYNCKYMGAWQHAAFEAPLDVFYIKKPTVINDRLAEKYVGVYVYNGLRWVDIDDIFDRPIVGAEADNGEICISGFDGDYYISEDKSTWVDGGQQYFQSNKPDRLVSVYIHDDKFEFEPLGLIEVDKQDTLTSFKTFFQIYRP